MFNITYLYFSFSIDTMKQTILLLLFLMTPAYALTAQGPGLLHTYDITDTTLWRGQHTGYNPLTGQVDDNIDTVNYSGLDSQPQVMQTQRTDVHFIVQGLGYGQMNVSGMILPIDRDLYYILYDGTLTAARDMQLDANSFSPRTGTVVDVTLDADLDGDPDVTDCRPLDPTVHHGDSDPVNREDDNCDGYVDKVDNDQDTLDDRTLDLCPGTQIPEWNFPDTLGKNRYALENLDILFDNAQDISLVDTGGCSCSQLLTSHPSDGHEWRRGCLSKTLI